MVNATLGRRRSSWLGSAARSVLRAVLSPKSCSSGRSDTVCENWRPLAGVVSTTYNTNLTLFNSSFVWEDNRFKSSRKVKPISTKMKTKIAGHTKNWRKHGGLAYEDKLSLRIDPRPIGLLLWHCYTVSISPYCTLYFILYSLYFRLIRLFLIILFRIFRPDYLVKRSRPLLV